ncbi:hypothetical protein MHY87_07005 [Microvirga sp. ACRRW]|uniref:hypothetical protein n=1 Tax=Microvirga sp. ACRRW TaxID=2918205 RepID=UPI001EF3D84A|nr:hypothetical protein [Microvirga sp. ACRRW]MCG7392650.1 hypothetical protein [Microvirga sp. ACRRW]
MSFTFAIMDYDSYTQTITVITPRGRMSTTLTILQNGSAPQPELTVEVEEFYQACANLFTRWVAYLRATSADTKMVVAGTQIIVTVIHDDVPLSLRLDSSSLSAIDSTGMVDAIYPMANCLRCDDLQEAADVLLSILKHLRERAAAERD